MTKINYRCIKLQLSFTHVIIFSFFKKIASYVGLPNTDPVDDVKMFVDMLKHRQINCPDFQLVRRN